MTMLASLDEAISWGDLLVFLVIIALLVVIFGGRWRH